MSTNQRVLYQIKDLFLNPLGEVYSLVVVHLEVEVDSLAEVDPWEEVMELLVVEDFLNALEVDQLGISLEPWYPLWYPVLVISVPTIIFTRKSLSYLIYSIGTTLDAHVRVFKKGHLGWGEEGGRMILI
jgi:hypothetical protein